MKIFANRNIWKKIVIIFSLIFSMSFAEPAPVKAAGIGGELMEPVCDLIVGLGDGVLGVIHKLILNQETTLISINISAFPLEKVVKIVATILGFSSINQ